VAYISVGLVNQFSYLVVWFLVQLVGGSAAHIYISFVQWFSGWFSGAVWTLKTRGHSRRVDVTLA